MQKAVPDDRMALYAILLRSRWRSRDELQRIVARSNQIASGAVADDACWLRSYVLKELDGTLGALCVYAARNPEAIRKHAAAIAMPVDEIIGIAEALVMSPETKLAHGSRALTRFILDEAMS
jgi:Protein of unknown function (DUF4242)